MSLPAISFDGKCGEKLQIHRTVFERVQTRFNRTVWCRFDSFEKRRQQTIFVVDVRTDAGQGDRFKMLTGLHIQRASIGDDGEL